MDTTTAEVASAGVVEIEGLSHEEFEVVEAGADDESEVEAPELSIEELEELFRGLN